MKLIRFFEKQTGSYKLIFAGQLVLFLGELDYFTNPEFSFSIFYLIPVIFITWFGNKSEGVFIAILSAFIWLFVDIISKTAYSYPSALFWNTSVRLALFLVVVFILSKLKLLYKHQEEIVIERTAMLSSEILEKNKIESHLRRSEELYKNLLESITEFFYVVNSKGTIVYASNNLFLKLDYSENMVIGRSLFRFIADEDRKRAYNAFKNFVRTGINEFSFEFRFSSKNKEKFWVEQATRLIKDDSGKIVECRNVARDIAERKLAEEVLLESEKRIKKLFDTANNHIEEADLNFNSAALMNSVANRINDLSLKMRERLKQIISFSSLVSHELKTPLSIIRLQLEDVLRPNVPDKNIEEVLISVYDEVLRMNHILEDLLKLSTIEAGVLKLQKEKLELNSFLSQFCCEVKILLKEKKLDFIFLPCEEVIVEIDVLHFRQVLFNLIDNAIKYTPENGGIVLSCLYENHFAEIILMDTGYGVPPEEIKKIFAPFYKTDYNKKLFNGAGLGLMIVQKIIDLHNGSITIDSSPGRGSSFIIRIPSVS